MQTRLFDIHVDVAYSVGCRVSQSVARSAYKGGFSLFVGPGYGWGRGYYGGRFYGYGGFARGGGVRR